VHEERFEDLTWLLASHTSRRQFLMTAVWAAVAVLVRRSAAGQHPGGRRLQHPYQQGLVPAERDVMRALVLSSWCDL
jgi:hypothetical protein